MEQDNQAVRDAFSAINPFVFRSETGRIILYESAKESYELCLMALWSEFPTGFVDVPYFMTKHQKLTPAQIWNICPIKHYAVIRWWERDDPERNATIRRVLSLLLRISGAPLDEELFQHALSNLDSLLDKQGVREKLSKLNNIHLL